MANTLTNFIIGLGYDLDEKSFDKATSSVDLLASKAKLAGVAFAAVSTVMIGAGIAVNEFAKNEQQLANMSDIYQIQTRDIMALRMAYESLTGNAGEGVDSLISRMAELQAITPDQLGALFESVGIIGYDPTELLNAKGPVEAMKILAEDFKHLSADQRLNLADRLGIGRDFIPMLSKGSGAITEIMDKFKEVNKSVGNSSEEARAFNKEWVEMKTNVTALVDTMSASLLPVLTDLLEIANGIGDVFSTINEGVNFVGDKIVKIGGGTEAILKGDVKEGILQIDDALGSPLKKMNDYEAPDQDIAVPLSGTSRIRGAAYDPTQSGYMRNWVRPQAQASQAQQAQDVNVHVTVDVDGNVLEKKIIKTMGSQFNTSLDEMITSTRG